MMAITCPEGLTHYAECPGVVDQTLCGDPNCPHLDPDGAFDTGGGAGCTCCKIDHGPVPDEAGTRSAHRFAAQNCPGNHEGPCPEPDTCKMWKSIQRGSDPENPLMVGDTSVHEMDCPGGHCHKDVEGCTVCRPLSITMIPGGGGAASMRPAIAVGG